MKLTYDQAKPEEIEKFAQNIVGKSLRDYIGPEIIPTLSRGKGKFGQAIEKYYFGINPGNSPYPDFKEAGVELKTTRIKKNSKNQWTPKERLVLNAINYMTVHQEEFESSSLMVKAGLMLLMFYKYEGEPTDLEYIDYVIEIARLWKFPEKDLEIIKDDWEKILTKIRNGEAHKLSEGDTVYLAACHKGVNSQDVTPQPFSEILAQKRAFSLKQGYLKSVLNGLIDAEEIIKRDDEIQQESFEQIVLKKFRPYLGKTIEEIHTELNLDINKRAKSYYSDVTRKILGVSKRKIEEFEKANIAVKTIRLRKNGVPKEDISFPYFKYKELAVEEWDDSPLRERIEKKYLFVVYQYTEENNLKLVKVMFWTMPYEGRLEVEKVWNITKEKVIANLYNELPRSTENEVSHVRPHARDAADQIEGLDGTMQKKKSFWINKAYIGSQIGQTDIDSISV